MGNIITISGTSGAGKSFFVDQLTERYNIEEIPGITTRSKRPNEIDGKSSYYVTMDYFQKLRKEEQLTLIKEFFDKSYAWLKSDLVNNDQIRVMNISYKSIVDLRNMGLNVFAIFVRPTSFELLTKKLNERKMVESELKKRLNDFNESEIYLSNNSNVFNFILSNGYDEASLNQLFNLVESEKIGLKPCNPLEKLIKKYISLDQKIKLMQQLNLENSAKRKG